MPTERFVLFFEDFESGMPATWQVIDGNSDGFTWEVGTTDDLFFTPPNYGTAYAYYSDDDAGVSAPAGTEYLISPAVSCASIGNLRFSYSWAFTIFDPPIGASYIRFHNGSAWGSWNQLATYYVDAGAVDTFDLTGYLPADSLQVQFTYEDPTGGWGWAFGIDNVLIESPADHDVGMASIDIPVNLPTDTTFFPEATVKNYGLNTESFDVTCEINPGAFSSTVSVYNLDPDSTESVVFPDSFTFASGLYTVTVYTQLAGDENLLNDTMVVEVTVTDWLIYDDGFAYGNAYWFDPGNGWGVQFPVTEDWWVDSIACFLQPAGANSATFRIYDGASAPTNMRWELANTTIQTNVWNYIGVDTMQTWFTVGSNVFFMYYQVGAGGYCPALSFDYEADYPDYMWYSIGGSFTNGTVWGGDWMMRIHITNPTGVGEWVSLTPNEAIFRVPTIVSGKASVAFSLQQATEVELAVYDAVGRKCMTLINVDLPAGDYQNTFLLNLPAGVYFYSLKTEAEANIVRKFLLVR
ncbi:MAG: T9SS type A sorting domain-containing protein [candidate division WOR-3 bacterium]|nr:T9SS type A sorting domain-containing protein [candidate division WOR-3 bacterium]